MLDKYLNSKGIISFKHIYDKEIIHMSKFKPKAVEQKYTTIGIPVRSETTPPLYCPCNAVRNFSHLMAN